jgi:hypothetical protein
LQQTRHAGAAWFRCVWPQRWHVLQQHRRSWFASRARSQQQQQQAMPMPLLQH